MSVTTEAEFTRLGTQAEWWAAVAVDQSGDAIDWLQAHLASAQIQLDRALNTVVSGSSSARTQQLEIQRLRWCSTAVQDLVEAMALVAQARIGRAS